MSEYLIAQEVEQLFFFFSTSSFRMSHFSDHDKIKNSLFVLNLPTLTTDFFCVRSVLFFFSFAFSEGVKLSVCLHVCVCQRERIFARVHVRVGTFVCVCVCVCVCNSCVCVSLLLLASNWIFCPEFCLFFVSGRKAKEGYNSEHSRAF